MIIVSFLINHHATGRMYLWYFCHKRSYLDDKINYGRKIKTIFHEIVSEFLEDFRIFQIFVVDLYKSFRCALRVQCLIFFQRFPELGIRQVCCFLRILKHSDNCERKVNSFSSNVVIKLTSLTFIYGVRKTWFIIVLLFQ